MAKGHEAYLASATEPYKATYQGVEELLQARFPTVHNQMEDEVPFWRIPRPKDAPVPETSGTIDPDSVHVGLAQRKTGLTLHLWYPPEYDLLDRYRDPLEEAGLKVMKGCLQHNRKGPFPLDAIEPLLAHIEQADGF